MKKVIEKVKSTFKDNSFWIFSIIVIAIFGIFIKMEYATDSYCVFASNQEEFSIHFMRLGRFVTAFAQKAIAFFHVSNETEYILSFILAVICTIFSIYKIYKIFEKEVCSKIMLGIASVMIIINIFSIELYLFLEKGILMLSVLLCVLAFENIVKFFQGDKKAIILTFIYMIFANFSYQGTVALFVVLSCLYMIKHIKNIKTFITNNIITALCYGVPALINYLTIRLLFANYRVSTEHDFLLSLEKIFKSTQEMLMSTYNIIPQYVFIVIFIILILTKIIYIMIGKNNKLRETLGLIYLIVATYIVAIFPQIVQGTDAIGFAARNTYAFASILGILLLYIIIKEQPKAIIQKALIVVLAIYLSIQYISFENIARDRYTLNYMDYYQFLQIQDLVKEYEEETGKIINKVAFYRNDSIQAYTNLFTSNDINVKAMCPDWSRTDYLNYYFKRKIQTVKESEEIYNKYFKNHEWKFFDKEQVVFIEDTMHLFVY